MKIRLGDKIDIDLSRLVASRMLLQANSGGGKSWTLRRILEQSHGHIQQIVIDPEDEFYTLREQFDYILVRHDGGDCVPDVRSADLLARRLLELGVSAIISIYELSPRDRREFVRRFLESLVNAPKNLWHPALVVVDEAHEFCPEQGKKQKGDVVADAVIDLMAKGRKRGFCGILATQRLSKLNKDAAAEANNKLIGRASIDVDRKRAGEELGFTSKDDFLSLRQLKDGEFFAFGPAISSDVVRLTVGAVKTTHPKAGAGAVPIAPPKTKVKSILAQLADLPQEAEQERASVNELQTKVRELQRDLDAAKKAQPATKIETKIKTIYALKDSQITRCDKLLERFAAIRSREIQFANEQNGATREQLTTLTGLRRSTRNRYLQYLKSAGYITENGERFYITDVGLSSLGTDFEQLPTGDALQQYWLNKLPPGQSAILRAILEQPAGISRDEITEKTSLKRSTRNRYIQYLQAAELVTCSGELVRPSDTLLE